MVAAANPLATEAGYRVQKVGGSAIDVAVAVQMVLALVEPQSSGIGNSTAVDRPTLRPTAVGEVMSIDPTAWCEEVGLHSNLFTTLAHHLPAPLKSTQERLQAQLDT